MRLLSLLALATTGLAQTPLIGLNSEATKLPAGAGDIVASIQVDPSESGGDLLAVMLLAEGVRIRVELPDGRSLTQDSASAAKFQWEVSGPDQDFGLFSGKVNHVIVLPPKAPAGKYRIHADAQGLKEDSVLMLLFLPFGEPGAGATSQRGGPGRDTVRVALTETELFHYAGDTVQLVAGVFDGTRGVNGANLSGTAVAVDDNGMPKGQPLSVQFQPSGPGADGSYHAQFPFTQVGKYEVGLKVTGTYPDGTAFERGAMASISIEPRRAEILEITERPVDKDGNGLVNDLEVTARVKAELPGEYYLTVDLSAGTGHYMQVNTRAQLNVGEGTITGRVSNFGLLHVGADGPYKMSGRLFRKEGSGQAFASRLENAGMTRAYKQSDFDRGPIYFLGTANWAPQSATGSAPFDKLMVKFDVFTPGGKCQWHGDLLSGYSNVNFVNTSGQLPKGAAQIEVAFNGYDISNKADGKPLTASASMFCGTLEARLERPVAVDLFPASTFVKVATDFEFAPSDNPSSPW